MSVITDFYSREDIENKDKKIAELERDLGNLEYQIKEYQQIVAELTYKLNQKVYPANETDNT